jgi:betaine-homocysteine S-methyltransferase
MSSLDRLKSNILYRLSTGDVILGDGSYTFTLEKRGYVRAGHWTPECVTEYPEGVQQLAYEYARAGADVTQTFTFFCTDDKLPDSATASCAEINQAACNIAKKVAKERGTIIAAGITQTETYATNRSKAAVQRELLNALDIFKSNDVDLIICEYFRNIEEMEWALEIALATGKPVAATMCMGPNGDEAGVPVGECAVRMAKAGANLVGINCLFDPFICLDVLKNMKKALDSFGLKPSLMIQPLGFKTPDGGHFGWIDLPEFPYAVEPRQITRFEAARFARQAYDMGVRYIGGCCGFEPYHIRAMAEELSKERGKMPESSKFSDPNLKILQKFSEYRKSYKNKGEKDFWNNMDPATGRPRSTPFCAQSNPQTVCKAILE